MDRYMKLNESRLTVLEGHKEYANVQWEQTIWRESTYKEWQRHGEKKYKLEVRKERHM